MRRTCTSPGRALRLLQKGKWASFRDPWVSPLPSALRGSSDISLGWTHVSFQAEPGSRFRIPICSSCLAHSGCLGGGSPLKLPFLRLRGACRHREFCDPRQRERAVVELVLAWRRPPDVPHQGQGKHQPGQFVFLADEPSLRSACHLNLPCIVHGSLTAAGSNAQDA